MRKKMGKFSDLQLIDSRADENKKKVTFERAARLGYEAVAMDFKMTNLDRKTKIPSAPAMLRSNVQSDTLKAQGKQLKILSRLTVSLSDSAQTIALRSDSVATYDLLAVRPETEKMFLRACQELEIDIISCDLTFKLPFYFKQQLVKLAIERGIHFEICYSPSIRDATLRKSVFSNALSLVSASKGKNIIISSGSEHPMELRGPHDIANLGHLFGLKEDQANAAVSTNCQAAIMHAYTRNHTVRSVMSVQRVVDLPLEDLWMVKASLQASGVSLEQVKTQTEKEQIEAKQEQTQKRIITTMETKGMKKQKTK